MPSSSSSSTQMTSSRRALYASRDRLSAPPAMETRRPTTTTSSRTQDSSSSRMALDQGSPSRTPSTLHRLQHSRYHHSTGSLGHGSAGRHAAGVDSIHRYVDMGSESELVATRTSSSFETDDVSARRRPFRRPQEHRSNTHSMEPDVERRQHYARARDEAHASLQDPSASANASWRTTTSSTNGTRDPHNNTHTDAIPSLSNSSTRQRDSRPSKSGEPQHRVYLLNCKSCGSFLTDRGMKAVLLLKPHITLYSTDALPNCGSLCPPTRFADGLDEATGEPPLERTCDCLTQTLGCYGCGAAVGYHIVSPCDRCTSSVAKHQRSSNGHRTVLHCAEITVRERRYVPGEPGVRVAPFTFAPTSSQRMAGTRDNGATGATYEPVQFSDAIAPAASTYRPLPAQQSLRQYRFLYDGNHARTTSVNAGMRNEMDMDTFDDEIEEEDDDFEECDAEKPADTMAATATMMTQNADTGNASAAARLDEVRIQRQMFEEAVIRHRQEREYLAHIQQIQQRDQQRQRQYEQVLRASNGQSGARHLKRGDVVYWSDLVTGGERCAPIDSDEHLAMPIAGR